MNTGAATKIAGHGLIDAELNGPPVSALIGGCGSDASTGAGQPDAGSMSGGVYSVDGSFWPATASTPTRTRATVRGTKCNYALIVNIEQFPVKLRTQ